MAWLLDEGLELEQRDGAGVTPLHCAVFYMQRAVVGLLLARGARINTRDAQVLLPARCLPPCGCPGSRRHPVEYSSKAGM